MSLSAPLGILALAWVQVGQSPAHNPKTPQLDEGDFRPYPALTETRRSVTNFNVEVTRGLVVTPNGQQLFALSATASLIERFVAPFPEPADVWPTIHQPVALAFYDGTLLVLGGGTHALVRHSGSDGRVLDSLPLPSEPADLVVDQDSDLAWVSCQGIDAVVEIDLVTFTERRRYELGVKRPGFLSLDTGQPFVDDTLVYVTPMISGNNTLVIGTAVGAKIADGSDPSAYPGGGLPDVDLIRIDPRAPSGQALESVWRSAGSVLTAHGLNPTSGEYWVLGVDEDNADPAKADEPALRGRFATNVLARGPLPAPGGGVIEPLLIDLDDSDATTPGGQYDPATLPPASFPYALTFLPNGFGLVAASTSDRVTLVDTQGVRRADFELPAGSIPRQVVLSSDAGSFSVYCQGTNKIEVFSLAPPNSTPIRTYDLGHDPLPDAVRAGREIWYDGDRSENGRLSCNTCHPRGGADGIGWELSDPVLDVKDAMVTQSLMGIEDTFPYHWRGERDLRAFNGAFTGLLGAPAVLDEAPGSELDQFVEFVFSLQQPANPRQSARRRIEDQATQEVQPNGFVGRATLGVADYLGFGAPACNDCHVLPTGSLGDIRPQPIFSSQISSEASTEIPYFENFALRHQPIVDVATATGSVKAPLLGFGFSHNGVRLSAFHFIDQINILGDQQVADMTAFLLQYDHGIAPAAHASVWMDSADWYTARATVADVLIPQARRGWIDVCAFGTFEVEGQLRSIGWLYDPRIGQFLPDDPAVGPRKLKEFVDQAKAGTSTNLFLGVPPGNGFRLGLDRDHDGVRTGIELNLGTDPFDPDSDGDGDSDGHELQNGGEPLNAAAQSADTTPPALVGDVELSFVNARQAKLFVRSNEPTRLAASYATPGGEQHTTSSLAFDRVHTLLLRNLEPSTAGVQTNLFDGTIGLLDVAGNRTDVPIPAFASQSSFINVVPHSVIGELLVLSANPTGPSTLDVALRVRVDQKEGGPPAPPLANRVVIMQISKRDPATGVLAISADTLTTLPTSFSLQGDPYTNLPGPFLVAAPTDAAGRASITFTETGLVPGQELVCNIVAVLEVTNPGTYDPSAPDFLQGKPMQEYQMPATPAANRRLSLTF